MSRRAISFLFGILSVTVNLYGCIPQDTIDKPGRILLTIEGDESLSRPERGFVTADNWQIRFDHFFISLGDLRLQDCDSYTDTSYLRLVDVAGRGPQKVEEYYALGSCLAWFEIGIPRRDSPLGVGVSKDDRKRMIDGQDSVNIVGTATRGDITKLFSISMNVDINLSDCRRNGETAYTTLEAGDDKTFSLVVLGATAFFTRSDTPNPLTRFDALAAADDQFGNADGKITNTELDATPLDAIKEGDNYSVPESIIHPVTNLLEFQRSVLAERYVVLAGNGTCSRAKGEGDFE